MSIVTVEFQPDIHVNRGIHRPAYYCVEVCSGKRRKNYILDGAEFDEKKMEFTPVSGESTFEIYSDRVWRDPKKRKDKDKIYLQRLGLIGKCPGGSKSSGVHVYEVTKLVFGSNTITPDHLL